MARAAIEFLRQAWSESGYELEEHRFGGGEFDINLVAMAPGPPSSPVLDLCAHWDTVPGSPGADDNASGLAGVLEVARSLRQSPPCATIRFCLFGGEERGYLGSRAHVDLVERGVLRTDAAIVLEMIGFRSRAPGSQKAPKGLPLAFVPTVGDFIALAADAPSAPLAAGFAAAARRCIPALRIVAATGDRAELPAAAFRSDHSSYWRTGRAALLVTDTANFRNPHYHHGDDMASTLDYDFMAEVVIATRAAVESWNG